MKKSFLIILLALFALQVAHAQNQAAYFEIGKSQKPIETLSAEVKTALETAGFKIIGDYQPANSENLKVICYTRPDLEKIALSFPDRGALAAALKVGFKKDGASVTISMVNPMYLFYGYFVEGIDKQKTALEKISGDAKSALSGLGSGLKGFGGELSTDQLQKYHYKVMMPYFKDAEELKTFASFEEGLKTIRAGLDAKKGNTLKVYELVYADKKTAVFGVGIPDAEKGEAKFLPIIGDDHVAAMPYELILQGNQATILPGRFRIAIFWPELTMGTFMKIMSTPGDIADTLKGLTE